MVKSLKFGCFFDCPKRRVLKVDTYAEAIYKTLNVFDEARLKEEAEDYCKELDIGDGFEYADNKYKDLLWARCQVLNIAAVGLYHLWEKAVRDFFLSEFRNFSEGNDKGAKKTYEMILRANFAMIKEVFKPYPQLKSSLDVLAELAKVANVLKHGEGSSFYALMEEYPALVDGNAIQINDKIAISAERFRNYHQAVNEFWNHLPENLWVQLRG